MIEPTYVKCKVVKGFGRGAKELGCATANLDGIDHINLPTGIYCGLVQLVIRDTSQIQEESGFGDVYNQIIQSLPFISEVVGMVCSFGYNPQYGNKDKSLEVHILDDLKFDFYNAELRVLICKKMRDEAKYNSLEELKDAIANDIKNARNEVVNFKRYSSDAAYFILA